jgi:superfamily I DNA and/or RNA helicase
MGLRTKINTVDKFQGRERNIVIVSTVRSDTAVHGTGTIENKSAGFADSPERLNVALSRARRLLIVVGNKKFFSTIKDKQGNFLYRNAIREIESKGKVIEYRDLING